MKLTFLGATGTVTGSKYLLEAEGERVLVDCGLYQGVKQLRLRNWKPLPVDPTSIHSVLLTHAHIDHSGFLPALVRDGFKGRVFCTPPTADLCKILLPDAGRLQEEDARYANRKGFSKHRPALPLYTELDAEQSLSAFFPVHFDLWKEAGPFRFRLQHAGHILGAASIEVEHAGQSVLFSGDLGRSHDLLMRPPDPPGSPNWIVVESTYGDRKHEQLDPIEALVKVLTRTIERGGILLIPSFAVGRAQTLLYCLHEIFRRGLAEPVDVYVNSPMATSVTELFKRSSDYHRLSTDQCRTVCEVARYAKTREESVELTSSRSPAAIISASGMASGGRVLHHLRALAPDARNTILFPGFQAPGTRGHAMVNGADTVKIHGERVPIHAEIVQLDIFSAHADQTGLLEWLRGCGAAPRGVFVTHGEAVSADALRLEIKDQLGFSAEVPEYLETVDLS
jgi:metallo-beta-lactamase family protein